VTDGRERNVLGGELEECGTDPMTGFVRDGCCRGEPDLTGGHTVCAVMTEMFLKQQKLMGNDLTTPRPEFGFPGLRPGDRWCVVSLRWLQSYEMGSPCPVVLASTSERALEFIPLEALRKHAVDVPADPSSLL